MFVMDWVIVKESNSLVIREVVTLAINCVCCDIVALGDGHLVLSATMCDVLGGVLVNLERERSAGHR